MRELTAPVLALGDARYVLGLLLGQKWDREIDGLPEGQHDSHFLAIREERAADALVPNLLREVHHICDGESLFFKEAGLVGEGEHPFEAESASISDASGNDGRANALDLGILGNGERPHFGEVYAHDMERTGADDLVTQARDFEVADRLVDFANGPMEHVPAVRPEGDEGIDRFGIGEPSRFNTEQWVLLAMGPLGPGRIEG